MAEPRPSSKPKSAITLRVLLVADASAARESLQRALGDAGHDVVARVPTAASLEDPASDACDVVVLDLATAPDAVSTLVARLRRRPGCVDRPIVAVTDGRERAAIDRAIALGVEELALGPVHPAELSFRLRALAESRRVRGALVETARTLTQRTRELEAANEARRTIASFLVHDLKNPLQSVALGAHLLLHARELDRDAKDVVRTISDQSDRMKRLVRELLDLERGDGTELVAPLEPLRGRHLIEMAEAIARAERNRAVVQVEGSSADATVLANAQLVHRVLVNLVDNAIRHSPRDEPVRVTIDRTSDSLRVRVIDRGAGLNPAQRSGVFDRGARRPSSDARREERDGIGLAFCKAALASMHGTIEALESEGGTGATFEVRWPLAGNHRACA